MASGPVGGIDRERLDLEAGPGPQAMAGEVHVVGHLVGEESPARLAERELPGVERRLDDEVGRSHDQPALGRLHLAGARVGPAHDVRLPLGQRGGAGGDPHAHRARAGGLDRDARGGEQLGDAAELDAVRTALPSERPDQAQVAGYPWILRSSLGVGVSP